LFLPRSEKEIIYKEALIAKRGVVVWLTGFSGAGKTSIAKSLEKKLLQKDIRVKVLDGDELRNNSSFELGFSKEDREEHAKRVAQISNIICESGITSIVALISPYRSSRAYARKLIGNFVEVWVKCSIETCTKRDTKGLYKMAFQGKITNLTGIQDLYEPPLNPEVTINTERQSPDECADKILKYLVRTGLIQLPFAK